MWQALFSLALAVRGPVIPSVDLPPRTLLLREHISGWGPERTGNWRERFDDDGCWSAAWNTWLWVDPALRGLGDPLLFYNAPFSEPWFCLDPEGRRRLAHALAGLSPVSGTHPRRGPIERWSFRSGARVVSVAFPAGRPPAGVAGARRVLEELAAEGVWGLSPEVGLEAEAGPSG